MKKIFFAFILISIISCKKETSANYDIYVVGIEANSTNLNNTTYKAMLWKNGVATELSNNGVANSIFVANSDVFVAGSISSAAVLWKNNVVQILCDTGNATNVYVSGTDVYVTGNEKIDGQYYSRVWKNGINLNLNNNDPNLTEAKVFISGTDVYLVWSKSFQPISDLYYPVVWKNGIELFNISNSPYSRALSLFVSGTDVYLSGLTDIRTSSGGNYATLWKNGVATRLSNNFESYMGYDRSLFVSGTDNYVVASSGQGNENFATLWKNGIPIRLSNNYSDARCVFVLGNDLFVAGEDYVNGISSNPFLTVWKNGIANRLNNVGSYYSQANSMYVLTN